MAAAPLILMLGDPQAAPMQPVVQCLEASCGTVRRAATFADVRRLVSDDNRHPDLIVVLQTWSDQFFGGEVLELLSLAPLARIVCADGDWCDSDGRTRDQWPLAVRVRVAMAANRIKRELAAIGGEPNGRQIGRQISMGARPLPLTASRGEIYAADFETSLAPAAAPVRVAVTSPDRAFREMLTRALRTAGQHVVEPSGQQAPAVLVWDADPWDAQRAEELAQLRARLPETHLIATVGFMRPELCDELCRAGSDSVWFKLAPYAALDDLIAQHSEWVSEKTPTAETGAGESDDLPRCPARNREARFK
ncbi:MAG: hypothetical protein EXS05_23300 [Planctomycetaceae bacterium]|nr:hypothetical protein [Planctomycetaceae bacterium]